jgi:hypothetical protein
LGRQTHTDNRAERLKVKGQRKRIHRRDAEDAEKRLKEIGHPDEIEKKKHFIGQADAHRQ